MKHHRRAFSLLELLVVMGILAVLSAVTIPAIQSVRGGHSVNRAIVDLSGTLEMARAHAMAQRTYVRVLLGTLPEGQRLLSSTIALVIQSSDGSTAQSDMSDAAAWPAVSRPLLLDGMEISDDIHTVRGVSTVSDATPSGNNVGVRRQVGALGQVAFDQVIQFGPNGEARVGFDQPARHIRLGIVPVANGFQRWEQAFLLRLSGVNGSVTVFRDDLISN